MDVAAKHLPVVHASKGRSAIHGREGTGMHRTAFVPVLLVSTAAILAPVAPKAKEEARHSSSLSSFPACRDPTLAAPKVLSPVSSPGTLAFPE